MSNKNDITGDVIRTKTSGQKVYADNWEKIFGKPEPVIKSRKAQPKHSLSQVHKDKSKVIPRKYKYKHIEE
tara:strand:+ start:1382 stop:1594 length:213 start_codon:yes stop_codon:yes gene_type:complete